jgi:hypothetical protein
VRFHKSGKRFQVSICAGPSESSVHANFVELRLLEVRILGILGSPDSGFWISLRMRPWRCSWWDVYPVCSSHSWEGNWWLMRRGRSSADWRC